MDLLEVLDTGSNLPGRLGKAVALVGVVLILGWIYHWPFLHPLVQGILDDRVKAMVDMLTPSSARQPQG